MLPKTSNQQTKKNISWNTFITLILAVLVGSLAGLIGTFFEIAITWLEHFRVQFVDVYVTDKRFTVPITFLITATLTMIAYYLVKKFAPEAGGSGIPEIEGAIQDLRPSRWWRVIPIKFIAGIGTLGSGMVLGREGPTVQLGASMGSMVYDISRIKNNDMRHTLLAVGSAGGLAAAFNAPLAGILLVFEEMHYEFKYDLISVKSVIIGAIMSIVVYQSINGSASILQIATYTMPPLKTLWLYVILGFCFGILGACYNKLLLGLQTMFLAIYQGKIYRFVLMGGLMGGSCGVLGLYMPEIVGEGYGVIHKMMSSSLAITTLLLFFVLRFLTSTVSFASGAAGGIFSPLLALGTLFGGMFGMISMELFPHYQLEWQTFAIAGMAALFSATVRAPITGLILVMEMTGGYQFLLPLLTTCVAATIIAQLFGGRPIYMVLLERILARSGKQTNKPTTSPT